MPWNDDSWRDSYDAWKLRSPDEEYGYYDYDSCDHEDAETDCLDGRVVCHRCGEQWYASTEELAAEHQRIREYAEYEDRQNRRQWWRDLWLSVKSIFYRRRPFPSSLFKDDSDDIPF